jgi:hypothetical protein
MPFNYLAIQFNSFLQFKFNGIFEEMNSSINFMKNEHSQFLNPWQTMQNCVFSGFFHGFGQIWRRGRELVVGRIISPFLIKLEMAMPDEQFFGDDGWTGIKRGMDELAEMNIFFWWLTNWVGGGGLMVARCELPNVGWRNDDEGKGEGELPLANRPPIIHPSLFVGDHLPMRRRPTSRHDPSYCTTTLQFTFPLHFSLFSLRGKKILRPSSRTLFPSLKGRLQRWWPELKTVPFEGEDEAAQKKKGEKVMKDQRWRGWRGKANRKIGVGIEWAGGIFHTFLLEKKTTSHFFEWKKIGRVDWENGFGVNSNISGDGKNLPGFGQKQIYRKMV